MPKKHIEEFFQAIPGFEQYEISNLGRILNVITGHELHGSKSRYGYVRISLRDRYGKPHGTMLHRLVAEAFLPNYDDAISVVHINENKYDNAAANLKMGIQKVKLRKRHEDH